MTNAKGWTKSKFTNADTPSELFQETRRNQDKAIIEHRSELRQPEINLLAETPPGHMSLKTEQQRLSDSSSINHDTTTTTTIYGRKPWQREALKENNGTKAWDQSNGHKSECQRSKGLTT